MATAAAVKRNNAQIGRRLAAGAAQLASYLTTLSFVWALGIEAWAGAGVALLAEFVLFWLKTLVLEGKGFDLLGGLAVAIDTLLNAGGIWLPILNLNDTPTWKMLADGLSLESDVSKAAGLVIALFIGFVLSIAPHRLWNK